MAAVTVLLTSAFPGVSSGSSGPDECPSTIHNLYECSRYLEAKTASLYPKLLSRKGGVLSVNLESGRTKSFVDVDVSADGENWSEVKMYALKRYFPAAHFALIDVTYYESGSFILLNMVSGDEYPMNGDVSLSPDNKRVAVWNYDLGPVSGPNSLSVYVIERLKLVQEFLLMDESWGVEKLKWRDSGTIDITAQEYAGNDWVSEHKTLRFIGKNIGSRGRWRLE